MDEKRHSDYYLENYDYARYLNSQELASFSKYVSLCDDFTVYNGCIIEFGCGAGQALWLLKRNRPDIQEIGIDLNEAAIELAREKGIRAIATSDQPMIPRLGVANTVAAFNVLEHTDDPESFLQNCSEMLVSGGHLVLGCPNFLSITNNYHWHTAGLWRKIKNLLIFTKKYFSQSSDFNKMETKIGKVFEPDDDACVVTNPIDISNWARKRNMSIVYYSGLAINEATKLQLLIDSSPLRCFLGYCLFVFRKN